MNCLTEKQLADFHRDGFVGVKGLVESSLVNRMVQYTDRAVAQETGPVEYEADLGYPGSPVSRQAAGGRTLRRLLKAIGRNPVFMDLATHPDILIRLRQLLGEELVLPLAHHNCIMVKAPRYGTATGWHQDIRYWRYQRPELVTVLLALNNATEANGCLQFIPGSHNFTPKPEQLDEKEFIRLDLPENQTLIGRAVPIVMAAGDVVFFHCRTFHAAGSNKDGESRKSVLFTYRSSDNPPLAETRSSSSPELLLHA